MSGVVFQPAPVVRVATVAAQEYKRGVLPELMSTPVTPIVELWKRSGAGWAGLAGRGWLGGAGREAQHGA